MYCLLAAPLADLCQLENGNCEQTCYNLCNMKTKCGCYPGYKLAYDGKTCIGKTSYSSTVKTLFI